MKKLNDRESGLVKLWMKKGLSKAEAIARVRGKHVPVQEVVVNE